MVERPLPAWLLSVLLLSLAVFGSSSAAAQPMAGGFHRHADVLRSGPLVALACADDRAFVRNWHGDVAQWDGASWSALPRLPDSVYGRTLAASPEGRVFTSAGARILEWDGRAWQERSLEPNTPERGRIWAGADGVYVAARGRLLALDGDIFRGHDAGTWRELRGIWGTADELFLVGQGGTVMHHDGHAFRRLATHSNAFFEGVWGSAADDVWVWPQHGPGPVHHFDGTEWRAASSGLQGQTRAIGGTASETYAAGDYGLARWSGARWSPVIPVVGVDSPHRLMDICATRRHILVADGNGDVLIKSR